MTARPTMMTDARDSGPQRPAPQTSALQTSAPQYPKIHVRTASDNPFAWVAAVRLAMRQAEIEHPEIERFTEEALADSDAAASREVCRSWVRMDE